MHNIDNWKGSIIQLTSFTQTASTNNYVYHQVHDELFGLTIIRGIIQPAAFQLSPSINTLYSELVKLSFWRYFNLHYTGVTSIILICLFMVSAAVTALSEDEKKTRQTITADIVDVNNRN